MTPCARSFCGSVFHPSPFPRGPTPHRPFLSSAGRRRPPRAALGGSRRAGFARAPGPGPGPTCRRNPPASVKFLQYPSLARPYLFRPGDIPDGFKRGGAGAGSAARSGRPASIPAPVAVPGHGGAGGEEPRLFTRVARTPPGAAPVRGTPGATADDPARRFVWCWCGGGGCEDRSRTHHWIRDACLTRCQERRHRPSNLQRKEEA
jgi:hypothetical protein